MKIISTTGDPNGIGIECLAKALDFCINNFDWFADIELEIAGSPFTIESYLRNAGMNYIVDHDSLIISERKFKINDVCQDYEPIFGKLDQTAGSFAAHSIEYALSENIAGKFDAMLTMPISKESIRLAGWKFPGHTEMIATACNIAAPLMILFHENIRVGLVTFHTPIKDVPGELSCNKISNIANAFYDSLINDFGVKQPRIAMLGLNPHAGENGNIGREELEIIIPVINNLKESGIDISGPFSADGFFGFGEYKNFDGILAMYHDQGLIPLKLMADGNGVNFTAGLPIIRTSPDHGTAFNLAGKNIADPISTVAAIKYAYLIYGNRKSQ